MSDKAETAARWRNAGAADQKEQRHAEPAKTQILHHRSSDCARRLGADEDKATFEAKLAKIVAKIATAKVARKSAT
jgi:hypothetical protein